MLIIDFYTLKSVYSLYLTKQVILNRTRSLNFKDIMWINTTFGELITGFNVLAILNVRLNSGIKRNEVGLGIAALIISDDNFSLLLGIVNLGNTAELGDDCKSLRLTSLEKLLNSRKTLRNIVTGNTTAMEGSHGKLCTRLTDGLCSDNTYCLADLYSLTCCHVGTITLSTYT